jgi:acetolactate synthase-1/2/3 large subunit
MGSKAAKTGAQVVVESLERQGVRYVFGIPGAKIDKVFDTLASSSIQTVVCRHEQNAAFIAGGIGRLTGRAGVAIATSGPGVSNLTTGLLTANSEGDPVVALGGAVATSQSLKHVHQTFQAVSAFKPLTKFSAEANSPESIGETVANAFLKGLFIKSADEIGSQLHQAFEMPGPVLIGINVDYRDNHKLFERVHQHLLI